ncbi:hypothetical protein AO268_01215 [Pseudomonas sp. ICMP 8385]|nr:hypothetical protein BLL38_14720 [Pseudomonas gessardii]PHN57764.1 hypothetical protein AO268_01215 [Pseudomonas sp. ICMP 8385]
MTNLALIKRGNLAIDQTLQMLLTLLIDLHLYRQPATQLRNADASLLATGHLTERAPGKASRYWRTVTRGRW